MHFALSHAPPVYRNRHCANAPDPVLHAVDDSDMEMLSSGGERKPKKYITIEDEENAYGECPLTG
jgi:hypothetical protein